MSLFKNFRNLVDSIATPEVTKNPALDDWRLWLQALESSEWTGMLQVGSQPPSAYMLWIDPSAVSTRVGSNWRANLKGDHEAYNQREAVTVQAHVYLSSIPNSAQGAMVEVTIQDTDTLIRGALETLRPGFRPTISAHVYQKGIEQQLAVTFTRTQPLPGFVNKAGNRISRGLGPGINNYYCGRPNQPCACGRCDGVCGPTNGCCCPSCAAFEPPFPPLPTKGASTVRWEPEEKEEVESVPVEPVTVHVAPDKPPVLPDKQYFAQGYPTDLFVDGNMLETLNLSCPICLDVVRDVVESPCGHLFCRACIEGVLCKKEECPLDSQPLQSGALTASSYLQRVVLNMKVRCLHFSSSPSALPSSPPPSDVQPSSEASQPSQPASLSSPDPSSAPCSVDPSSPSPAIPSSASSSSLPTVSVECAWVGDLRALVPHLQKECPLEPIVCVKCEASFPRHTASTHATHDCPQRDVTCPLCNATLFAVALPSHQADACSKRVVSCPNHGCSVSVPFEELAGHCSSCENAVVPCLFASQGCPFSGLRSALSEHLSSPQAMQMHLALLLAIVERPLVQAMVPVFARGTGWHQRKRPGYEACVFVGGRKLAGMTTPGLLLVVLDRRTLELHSPPHCLNTNEDPQAATALVKAIEPLDYNHLVIVCSSESWEKNLSSKARIALVHCGATDSSMERLGSSLQGRHPFAMAGVPGLGSKGGLELVCPARDFAPFADLHFDLSQSPLDDRLYSPRGLKPSAY